MTIQKTQNINYISVEDSYDIIAKEFSVTRVFTWKWTDEFINNISDNKISNNNKFILDIGCGNGRNLNYSNFNIIGIDISIEQLKQNNSNFNTLIRCNMCDLPFKNNSFDYIICIASFHHLDSINERIKCLKEMKRVLNNNSKILLSVWSINQPKKTRRKFDKYGDTIVYWRNIPRYYYIFEINEIKQLISEYFEIEKHFWDCGNEIFILI